MSMSLPSGSSKAGYKTMSVSVRRLQDALNMHLDVKEKSEFVEVLNQFHIARDVPKFVTNLKKILDTPAKKQIFSLIRKVIPKLDIQEFDHCVRFEGRKYDTVPAKRPKYLPQRQRTFLPMTETVKKIPNKSKTKVKSAKMKEEGSKKSESSKSSRDTLGARSARSLKSLKSAVKAAGNDVLNIQIKQSNDSEKGFGFSIRGGAEFGIGIYVSMVDKGGMAERQGLVPGDLIMEVNDVAFAKMSHADAAQMIRSARKLDMKVCRVGRIPGTFVVHQMYKWVDPHGRPVTPPPELEQLGQTDSVGRKSGFALLKGSDECKVNVTVGEGESLGLMIRGGREFGLGIYISGVDAFSLADEAGLKVGDQILDVNGHSFLDISHAEAVHMLKVSRHLIFTIKDVGKLPYARTKIDQTNWLNNPMVKPQRRRTESQNSGSTYTSSGSVFTKGIGSQLMLNTTVSSKWDMIESQATELLNEVEQGTLRYYLSEYQRGFITVDGLAMASFELLNTKAKMTMMTEIRNWVRPRDIDKFDILLQRREARQREGFLSHSFRSNSLSRSPRMGHNPGVLIRTSASAPVSRAATMRSRPVRRHPPTLEFEMEPLRQAIEQIEDDPDFMLQDHGQSLLSSRLRSYSSEQLHSPNLLKTSLASRRSLSQEMLTPVYIDTTSELPNPPFKQRANRNSSQRPKSAGSSQRSRVNTYSHRQRPGSSNSTLRRRHRSMDDVRPQAQRKVKATPYSSRSGSEVDIRSQLSSSSYTHLKYAYDDYSEYPQYAVSPRSRQSTNIVQAEVHHQPRPADGIPSDDSGVEVNGVNGNENLNRVTISSDNPVDIGDVLDRRDSIVSITTDLDHGNTTYHSNASTLTNRKSRRPSVIDKHSTVSSRTSSKGVYPPEIRINDGEGSIDTISVERPPSPKFISQPHSRYNSESFHSPVQRKRRPIRGQSSYDADDEPETFDIYSDLGDSDLFVSPLDRVLDEEDDSYSDLGISNMDGVQDINPVKIPRPGIFTSIDLAVMAESEKELQQIAEAKKKYGDIPLDIIPVYKTKPTLGMAIEGGANTRQPLPRVINLQPGGSAYESGGLKVGHVILEVNGKSLVGLEHITAAKSIAEAFKNKAQDNMELLVTESDAKVQPQS